jgi:hypothetical protein
MEIKIGESKSSDLTKSTWTFKMEEGTAIKAGQFAIIDITNMSVNQTAGLFKTIENL